jgi:Asp-tRNA(Asn)/Glu-tRNA(Gln) amidotransferase A subunit family amidase
MNPTKFGAAQLARMIRDGELSALELAEACLDRIDAREDEIGAWIHFDRNLVRRQARERDARRAAGAPCGPLHGIPVGVKDIFDTEDLPTENGTALMAGRRPDRDAAAVRLLREAGAVVMGKTVTTELAMGASGKTRNPHNPGHSPGGSSSGSAAAVADFMVPLALGTQTAGSVIRPAAYCGVVGYKPSYGSISRQGVLSDSPFFDTVGAFARSVEDAALIGDVMMRYDPADPAMRLSGAMNLQGIATADPPVEPRFAFVRTAAWPQAEATTHEAFLKLAAVLGDRCAEIALPDMFDDAWERHRIIVDVDLAQNFANLYEAGPGGLSERMRTRIERGRDIRALDYNRAHEARPVFNARLADVFAQYDAIITPATTGEAPAGLESTGEPVFNALWTYCGVPAVSLPLLEGPNGLPLGVQLVGARGDDARLLRTARWLSEWVARAT